MQVLHFKIYIFVKESGQQARVKMLNIISHQETARQNHRVVTLHTY